MISINHSYSLPLLGRSKRAALASALTLAVGSLTIAGCGQASAPVAAKSAPAAVTPVIAIAAKDADGSNTGTARLGVSVSVTATVSSISDSLVTFTLQGAGKLTTNGNLTATYTPPQTMPADAAVTIVAALSSNTADTISYPLTLVNPVPVVSTGGVAPAELVSGTTQPVVLTGSGFVPGTTVLLDGVALSTTYTDYSHTTVQVTVAAGATAPLTLQVSNPAPGGGKGTAFSEPIATQTPVAPVTPVTATVATAGRLLDQTTFGPTASLIQHVELEGIEAWLTEQFNAPTTLLPTIPATLPSYCATSAFCNESEWWKVVLTGNDQLRQRVALALNEQFVISSNGVQGYAVTNYANVLANDAFTNWFTIMKDVTLSPAMGQYLNMLDSAKATGTDIANENYARENMQLFNLGIYLINQDGTPKLDGNGNPQPIYDQAQVEAFARVFTGWTYANPDGSTPSYLIGTGNFTHPMVAVEKYHDETEKTLLNGTALPAGQTAEQDLDAALTNIFNHPNLPPFVCTQLIQHLVTGNPSPAYISRVASVFIDNGDGVRGDMKSVLHAILTDPEARAGDTDTTADAGHLREPMLYMTAVMRGLGYVSTDKNGYYRDLSNYTADLGEYPFGAQSVFNFFPPTYVIPDSVLPNTNIVSPEFSLENTGSVIDRLTIAGELASNQINSFNVDLSATSPLGLTAAIPATLVDTLGTLFMHGQMDSDTRSAIIDAITPLTDPAERVQVAVYLVVGSSEYKVIH